MAVGKNIRSQCGVGNAPGIRSTMWICKKNEVTAITAAADGVIAGASAFTMSGAPNVGSFNVFELTPVLGKKTFETPMEGEMGGKLWVPAFTGFINGSTGNKSNILTSFVGCPCLIIFKDKTGKRWLIGDLDDGVYVDVVQKINEGENGYELTINGDGFGYMPYELNDNVTLTVAADV